MDGERTLSGYFLNKKKERIPVVEYSLFELAEFWLRAEEPEDNFSDDVKAAFQLIWDVAFQAGVEEVGFKEGD